MNKDETVRPKLTKAQARELGDMSVRDYRSHYADNYAPIKKLFALGFVDRQIGKYGSTTYAITDAGRAWISLSDHAQT